MAAADSTAYWFVVVSLCALGVLGMFSVGAPLLILGIVLVVVSPWRTNRAVLWPAVAGVAAFVISYVLVAPLGCTTTGASFAGVAGTAGSVGPLSRTVCSNVLGIDYSGSGSYQPSLAPALTVGVAAALAVGILIRRRLLHKRVRVSS